MGIVVHVVYLCKLLSNVAMLLREQMDDWFCGNYKILELVRHDKEMLPEAWPVG